MLPQRIDGISMRDCRVLGTPLLSTFGFPAQLDADVFAFDLRISHAWSNDDAIAYKQHMQDDKEH